ncbi:MAG TPA: ATP:cob(I)alamin adenosyltransferase, partial [Candidatus Saccharimonadales bacterium]|nr:ATP:cob(I)alamin adenosyltransferase [Candidatus Saccharimonadales bacterium]
MKVYTKTGDKGVTSLFGGTRKAKSDQIFDVLGTLDELNAQLGFVSSSKNKKIAKIVLQIQNDLFELGAQIANPKSVDKKASTSEFESIMDEL